MARIFVGLSGGVDSALSAALLSEAGHEVVGCFIRIWRPEFLECTWREDRLDAMRVAAHLRIPFREIDLSAEYEEHVIRDMVATYEKGETPNPDVLCNRHIKFDAFLTWALENGADMVATGHYARITHDPARLLRGIDGAKDQSYFLWQLEPEVLARVLCPVGDLTKTRVRAEAAKRSLPVATKKDSQGLCFVGDITIPEFLSRFITPHEGPIVTADGTIVGTHHGTSLYTLGQRHGMALGSHEPYYVIAIDAATNTLTVSHDPHDAETRIVHLRATNWLRLPTRGGTYSCAPRYHHPPLSGRLEAIDRDAATIHLDAGTIAAPGQSFVIYDGEELLGGGIITTVDNVAR